MVQSVRSRLTYANVMAMREQAEHYPHWSFDTNKGYPCPVHKAALADPRFTATALTRAFTGRPARGLINRFLTEHSPFAPAAYPQVHHLTSPLRIP